MMVFTVFRQYERSLIYKIKNNGPRTEPWGTQLLYLPCTILLYCTDIVSDFLGNYEPIRETIHVFHSVPIFLIVCFDL